MFKSIKKFFGFGSSTVSEVTTQSAPYKVETAVTVAPVSAPVVEVAPVVEAAPVASKPKAAKKPAAKKAPAEAKPKAEKKPVAKKAPAKITAPKKDKTLRVVK